MDLSRGHVPEDGVVLDAALMEYLWSVTVR